MFLILAKVSSYFDLKGLNRIVSISSKMSSIFSPLFRVRVLSLVSPLYYKGTSGKAHTPCRAVPWCRRCPKQNISLRREQAPTLRCNPIITQIGRENNISAEILLLRTVEDACPYKCCVKHPYENQPKPPFVYLVR